MEQVSGAICLYIIKTFYERQSVLSTPIDLQLEMPFDAVRITHPPHTYHKWANYITHVSHKLCFYHVQMIHYLQPQWIGQVVRTMIPFSFEANGLSIDSNFSFSVTESRVRLYYIIMA